MVATTVDHVYLEYVKALPAAERLELISLIASDLAAEGGATLEGPKHHLIELEGLGKEIWEGIDAQEYVNRLRDEWDERTP
jgi:hypothetical protein